MLVCYTVHSTVHSTQYTVQIVVRLNIVNVLCFTVTVMITVNLFEELEVFEP